MSRFFSFFKQKFPIKQSFSTSSKLDSSFSAKSQFITDSNKLKSKYDVVIIGAGHNGLVAANYLAKYSRKKLKICILERRDVIGGAACTQELIPGFKFSRASYLLSLFRPTIINDLDLMRHGILKFHFRNPSSYTPLLPSDTQFTKNSRSLTLSADAEFNRAQIGKFSKKDALNYEKYEDWLMKICAVLEQYLDKPAPDLKKIREWSVLKKLKYMREFVGDLKSAKFMAYNFNEIYRLFTEPAINLLDEWFESDVLKATLATDSVIGAMLSPYSEGSAYVLLHHVMGGVDNKQGVWVYVEGGMGSVSNCLAVNAKCFHDQIDIFLSQEVQSIELNREKTRAVGVLLSNEKFIEADYLLSNCTPKVTFDKLLSKFHLSEHEEPKIANFFKRVKKINYESGTMKINLATKGLPNFLADPNLETSAMPHHRATIHLNSENVQLIDSAFKEAKYSNRPSTRPMIEMVIPSSLDPTLAPKGAHVILLFCQYFPMQGADKETYAKIVFDSIENYAPGFRDLIIGKDVLTPKELEEEFGLTGGNIFHGAMPLGQLFINRPVADGCSYESPIGNLYLVGSGAHPGGGVMGSAGRLSALECLTKINS